MTSPARKVGLVDRLQAGVLTRRELQELAAALELAASVVRTIAECSEGEDLPKTPEGNVAVMLDTLGMTMADLSAAERGTLVSLAAEGRAMVRRLAGLIRRSR